MIKTLVASLLLTSVVVSAKMPQMGAVAPAYNSLRMMDSMVAALAKGGAVTGLPTRNPGDVPLHRATMTQNKTTGSTVISADLGNQVCTYKIKVTPAPVGITGPASYSASIVGCVRYINKMKTTLMKYEDIRKVLAEVASRGKTNLSFYIGSNNNVQLPNELK